jgi:anti-sigma B factor antagonist
VGERPVVPEWRGDFRVAVERRPQGPTIVAVAGDADIHSAPELRETLADIIDGGADRLVLDLSDATFLDSMALGVILGAKNRLSGSGGRVELVVSRPDIRRIFQITMLDRVFELHSSLGEAIRDGDYADGS